jgi:hypothetical protein
MSKLIKAIKRKIKNNKHAAANASKVVYKASWDGKKWVKV